MISTGTVSSMWRQASEAANASYNSSNSSSSPRNQLTGDSFIQLLTAQLQAQDPLNPTDPTTFVTQLVQFNQLEQLIEINQTLSSAAQPPANTTQAGNAVANLDAQQSAGTLNA